MHLFRNYGLKWLGIVLLVFIPLLSLYALEHQLKPSENTYRSVSSNFQYLYQSSCSVGISTRIYKKTND